MATIGIIKLHGTIAQDTNGLAATLADLQPGLHPKMRALLDDVFESVDAVIVGGYSGTDHFDVNRWIRARASEWRRTPKLIWLIHGESGDKKSENDEHKEPSLSWTMAFSGTVRKVGHTGSSFAELLGITDFQLSPGDSDRYDSTQLDANLRQLYMPTRAEKHLNGARLAVSIGMGQLAEEELRQCRHVAREKEAALAIEADIHFASGMKSEALAILKWGARANLTVGQVTQTKLLRHNDQQLQALWRLIRLTRLQNGGKQKLSAEEVVECVACALDLVEWLQQYALFRSWVLRRRCAAAIAPLWKYAAAGESAHPISVEGKIQTQAMRFEALLEDDDTD